MEANPNAKRLPSTSVPAKDTEAPPPIPPPSPPPPPGPGRTGRPSPGAGTPSGRTGGGSCGCPPWWGRARTPRWCRDPTLPCWGEKKTHRRKPIPDRQFRACEKCTDAAVDHSTANKEVTSKLKKTPAPVGRPSARGRGGEGHRGGRGEGGPWRRGPGGEDAGEAAQEAGHGGDGGRQRVPGRRPMRGDPSPPRDPWTAFGGGLRRRIAFHELKVVRPLTARRTAHRGRSGFCGTNGK